MAPKDLRSDLEPTSAFRRTLVAGCGLVSCPRVARITAVSTPNKIRAQAIPLTTLSGTIKKSPSMCLHEYALLLRMYIRAICDAQI